MEDPTSTEVAKLLTHVEASVREKTVNKICKWLKQREAAEGRIEDMEMQKLWKALYYCFWLTDKAPVQEEMSNMLAQLAQNFVVYENVNSFFVNFFAILRREWAGIDYLRLDKYLSLIRRMMYEWFRTLLAREFEESLVQMFVDSLRDEVIMPPQPDGLRMHLAFVYLPELARVTSGRISDELMRELLSPFFCVLIEPPSQVMLDATVKDVFQALKHEFPIPDGTSVSFIDLDTKSIGAVIFNIAAEDETLTSGRRKALYALAKSFGVTSAQQVGEKPMKEDGSDQKMQVEAPKPKKRGKAEVADQSEDDGEKQIRSEVRQVIKKLKFDKKKDDEKPTKTKTKDDEKPAKTKAKDDEKPVKTKAKDDEQSVKTKAKDDEQSVKTKAKDDEKPAKTTPKEEEEEENAASTATTPKKNVRFTHKDVMKINTITKRMRETLKKPAAEFGQPTKSLLKTPSKPVAPAAASASLKKKSRA